MSNSHAWEKAAIRMCYSIRKIRLRGEAFILSRCRINDISKGAIVWARKYFLILFSISAIDSAYAAPNSNETDLWGGIRLFEADLSARHQTILTQSDGVGFAKVRFDINTMEMTWDVEYHNLTSLPTGITLHGPAQPGTNAVAIIDLGVNGLRSPIAGTTKVSDAHIQYMLLGWTYILLKTEKFDHGELRGKVDTVPPPNFEKVREKYGHVPKR